MLDESQLDRPGNSSGLSFDQIKYLIEKTQAIPPPKVPAQRSPYQSQQAQPAMQQQRLPGVQVPHDPRRPVTGQMSLADITADPNAQARGRIAALNEQVRRYGPNVSNWGTASSGADTFMSAQDAWKALEKQNPDATNTQKWEALQKMETLGLIRKKPAEAATFDIVQKAYQDAKTRGLSEEEAVKAGVDAKRRSAVEEGLVAGEKVGGKIRGEKTAELGQRVSRIPQLLDVVTRLSDLGKKATFTTAGKVLDVGRKELGMAARPEAVARSEYISTVDNEILPLLRETFGAQFTQKEGESLKVTLGDDNLGPEQKDAVLRSFIRTKMGTINQLARDLGVSEKFSPDEINAVASSIGAPKTATAAAPTTLATGAFSPEDIEAEIQRRGL